MRDPSVDGSFARLAKAAADLAAEDPDQARVQVLGAAASLEQHARELQAAWLANDLTGAAVAIAGIGLATTALHDLFRGGIPPSTLWESLKPERGA